MTDISRSEKLHHAVEQYAISAGHYVLFRVVRHGRTATVMTATAGEDDGSSLAYPDQDALIAATCAALDPGGRYAREKTDRAGRKYVLFEVTNTPEEIRDELNSVIQALELLNSLELSRIEGREIYDAVAGRDDTLGPLDPYEDAVYMSDGVWLTPEGDWIRK